MKVGSMLAAGALALGTLAGCVDDSKADGESAGGSGGLFGGQAEPEGEAGSSGEPASAPAGRCSAVPPSEEPRIDNFEDGDDLPIVENGRRAAWHIPPSSGDQVLSLSVEQGGADDSDFAGHVLISGFSDRAAVGVSLRFEQDGVSCPYNVSGSTGIGFYAKGEGNIDLLLDTTDTWSSEFGGTCDDATEVCWDEHHKLVPLNAEWTYHEVPWDAFGQAGWGKLAAFSPDHFLGVQFAVAPAAMPAEFWLDDVRLLVP